MRGRYRWSWARVLWKGRPGTVPQPGGTLQLRGPGSRPSVWLSCTKGQLPPSPFCVPGTLLLNPFQGLRKVASEVRRLRDRTGRGALSLPLLSGDMARKARDRGQIKLAFTGGLLCPWGGGAVWKEPVW